ncbi:MAG: hypothetical protein JKY96_06160 [Phycisphaerales bacterium]|nr:hypothetical protein [Phycisphaerales bacterium]
MSRGTQIVLSLTSRELRGALVKNGSVLQAESFAFDQAVSWTEAWDDGLRPFDQVLRQMISRLSPKRGWDATLIYQSPSAVVQFEEIEGDKREAVAQAETKIRESIGAGGCIGTKVISLRSKGSGTSQACLSVADQDVTMRKLYAWMTRCGLKSDRMIPVGCVMMAQAIEESLTQNDGTAVCYMGEESSVISYAIDGNVKLVRSVEIGYRHINDGYIRVFSAGNQEAEQSEAVKALLVGRGDINELLWEFGVPMSGGGEHEKVLRREVLPRIAPILQRYSVEIKQTFRFGLSQQESPSRLVMCGPGAMIPYIGAALSQNCDLHIDISKGVEVYEPAKPFGGGTLCGRFARSGTQVPSILPRVAREIKKLSACNRAIAAGLAFAFGVMLVEIGTVRHESQQIRSELAGNASSVLAIENEKRVRAETIEYAGGVDQIATVFTENFGSRPHWTAAFEGISENMNEAIRIEQIKGDNADARPTVGLSGLAVGLDGADPSVALDEFVKELGRHDGVVDVRLGATARRTTSEGISAVHFELTIMVSTQNAALHEYTSLANAEIGKGN